MDTREVKIQNDVINLFKNMGYEYISPDDINLHRENKKDIILNKILEKSLKDINDFEYKEKMFKFSDKNIVSAIENLKNIPNTSQLKANENIYNLLTLGSAFQEEEQTNSKQSFTMKYIDFKNFEKNKFHITEEFIVNRTTQSEKEKTRRPDLVLFINGIPLGVIELKSNLVDIKEGISQMIRNQAKTEIPHLFQYSQILMSGNGSECKYATSGTPLKFWSIWREEKKEYLTPSIKNRATTEVDRAIFSLYSKERFLDIIQNYIIYDNNIKKIARYQQYFAIKDILERVKTFDPSDKRNGGLIWHTQGSGKSLTMVMLAMSLKREIAGAKIVVVTDRKDLDRQISATFSQSGFGTVANAKTGADLLQKISSGNTMITTVINKFIKVKNEKKIIEDKDVFILVDEAHRTQSSDLHKAMKKVFPNGCYLGFTGTPLLKSEKTSNSFKTFGGLIHSYKIDEAVKDEAVLPLLYEGRGVDQWINDEDGMNRKFKLITKNLNKEQIKDLEAKWVRFQKIASSEKRLEVVALDINEHFKNNFSGTGFKGMIVAGSKFQAIRYHEIFQEYGDIKTAFIISKNDGRKGYEEQDNENKDYVTKKIDEVTKKYGSFEAYEDKSIDEFLNGDSIEILIVVDKLITGFDAPNAVALYIDKEMRDHKLLQAIARVNRLCTGKEFGYIIDYRNLFKNLDNALNSYSSLSGFDEDDLIGTVTDIREEISKIKSYFVNLENIFRPLEKREFEDYCVFLATEELRKQFFDDFKIFSKALKIVLLSEKSEDILSENDIQKYKSKAIFYDKLRKAVRIRYHHNIDFDEYENQMQKLLDTYLSAGNSKPLTKLINIFDIDFDNDVKKIEGERAQADTIRTALTKVVIEKREENPIYYDSLVEKIKKILEEYNNKRIDETEYLNSIKEIKEMLINGKKENTQNYPLSLQNTQIGKDIYDNIKNRFFEVLDDKDVLAKFIKNAVVKIGEHSKKPEWKTNKIVQNKIINELEDSLYDLEKLHKAKFSFDVMDDITNDILSICKKQI